MQRLFPISAKESLDVRFKQNTGNGHGNERLWQGKGLWLSFPCLHDVQYARPTCRCPEHLQLLARLRVWLHVNLHLRCIIMSLCQLVLDYLLVHCSVESVNEWVRESFISSILYLKKKTYVQSKVSSRLLFGASSTPVLPQWHVKDPGHNAESTDDRLHLNTHTPLTQRSRSGLTLPLSRHSVGTYPETSSHTTIVREHLATVVSARWSIVDWSWPKEWN